jgi:hypothetical protein
MARVKTVRERDIERYLVKRAKAHGGEVRKVKWIGRNGAPDRLLMLPAQRATSGLDCAWCSPHGQSIWVELKAPGEKPEPHQVREHKRMRDKGQRVEVIDSFKGVDALLGGDGV